VEYLTLIGTVTTIHLLGLISPGPDFIVAVRNSLVYSRKTGVWTAVGFGLGITIHIFYSLAGLAIVISKSILLFNIIKYAGAGYLIYIGLRSFFSKSSMIKISNDGKKKDITSFEAVKVGFLTNILNPKVTLFFLSLFSMVVTPGTPLLVMLIMGAIMVINTILWFSFVSVSLSHKKVRSVFEKYQNAFNKTLGGLLVALGIKVAFIER
jgi:RhtB (resistance to homoserine/threonine) family protein